MDIKEPVAAIGQELLSSGTLTVQEREKLAKWSAGMAVALASGDKQAISNYRIAFSSMIGVAELRAAQASERAALRLADLAVSLITKAALAAMA